MNRRVYSSRACSVSTAPSTPFSEVFQKAPEPLHGRIIAGVLDHIAGGLRQHACHHSRIRRTAEQLVEQRVQIRARQKQRLQVDGLATHVDDIGHDGSLL